MTRRPHPVPPPLSPTLVQLPRLVGGVILAVAVGLAVTAPASGDLDLAAPWWRVWVSTAAIALAASPLTMLLLWRNARKVAVVDDDGHAVADARGRPRTRRVELRGSRALFQGLALQSATLIVLIALLLIAVGLGS